MSTTIAFPEIEQGMKRWPGIGYEEVRARLVREAKGLPAVPPRPEQRCMNCNEVMNELGSHSWCQKCRDKADEEARCRAAKAAEDAPLPSWPECWPLRAVLDIKRFSGVPLEKAQSIEPMLLAGGMLALIGDRGRGKTVMAAWLANERRQRREMPGIYMRAHDLFEVVRDTYGSAQPKRPTYANRHDFEASESGLLDRFRTTPFLVIDEIQERGESDWENRTLVNILDHRYANILPTLLIGNLGMKELNTNLGPSIVDRMTQTGAVLECTWENFREPDSTVYSAEEIDSIDWSGSKYSSKRSGGFFA